jgi:hypothetical protein
MESSVSYTELVPLGKKSSLPPPNSVRRAPSYSDSFLVLQASSKQSTAATFEYLDLAPVSSTTQLSTLAVVEPPIPNSRTSKIAEKVVGFVFHIFLISIFESAFFRLFITKSEDKGILTTVQRLVGNISQSCPTWNANQTVIVNDILGIFVNSSQIVSDASVALQTRTNYNATIFARSWMYVGILGGTLCVTAAVSFWRGWIQKTAIRHIALDNIGLVVLLGLYEYMFFSTVIYNYDSISVPEIEGNIVQMLQTQCGLFSN